MRPTPNNTALGIATAMALLTSPGISRGADTHLAAGQETNSQTGPKIEGVIRIFMDKAPNDAVLKALLEKHRITLEYSVTDLGMTCLVGTGRDRGQTAGSRPALRAEIVFTSDSQTLDQLLRGVAKDLQYDMELHLNLVRRLKLAADLKAIRAALSRVYTEALDASAASLVAHTASN